MKKLTLSALSIILLLGGCTADKTGNFELYLTDQPIEGLEQVLITITAIKVQKDDESIVTVWEGERTFDLLLLQDIEERILDVELEEGTYTHVIIVISEAAIVVHGITYDISISPGLEVRIPVAFTVLNNNVTEVVLDFQADQSIEGLGDQYVLIPVITVKRVS
ncbi:MAG: DUF4382 domain-containing protein [Candidatus Aminicenantes bacterium]|nr:DUF4382 domain-containing protein [Candidatus Aminicenantes bacterium]